MSEYTAVFPVGKRTCRVSATVRTTAPLAALSGMIVTWTPDNPGAMNASEQVQYANGVSSFLATLSNALLPLSVVVP
jgi:hypothetical protein